GIKNTFADETEEKRILLRIQNNIATKIDVDYVQSFVLNELIEKIKKQVSTEKDNRTAVMIEEILIKDISRIINRSTLNKIPCETITFLRDTKDSSFFFFKNDFVEVSKNGTVLKDYSELLGYIWKSQIIQHDFAPMDMMIKEDLSKIQNFDFVKWTQRICSIKGINKETNEIIPELDPLRYNALKHIIGYGLHDYIAIEKVFAVVLTEANIDGSPEGRTGKGLLLQALQTLRKKSRVDGKTAKPNSQFFLQNVEMDTKILHIDDIRKDFNFEQLFGLISEGFSVEKKNQPRYNLSPEKSPKVFITCNYAVKGISGSFKARIYDMELLCYYNSDYTPLCEFKKPFLKEVWTPEEWNLFYNFMFFCQREYFLNNCVVPKYPTDTVEYKKLLGSTNEEFIKYAEKLELNTELPKRDVYDEFLRYSGFTERDIKIGEFKGWIKHFCSYKKLQYKEKINSDSKDCHILIDEKQAGKSGEKWKKAKNQASNLFN
ncbi:MAG: hypothetical protein WCT77_06660, partial [Bacteroidota bacterium]